MSKWKKIALWIISLIIGVSGLSYFFLMFFGRANLHLNSEGEDGDIRVACVGDSITYGANIPNWYFNNYPKQLDKRLGDGYNVGNFGATDRTVSSTGDKPYSNEKIYQESLEFNPDIVVIMLGTNDSKLYNWPGKEEFKSEYEDLIDSYLKLQSDPVIFIGTPSTAFYVKEMKMGPDAFETVDDIIGQERDVVYEIAEENNLSVIDIHAYTDKHPEWFRKDGVHPDADGAKAMADFIYDHIKETL